MEIEENRKARIGRVLRIKTEKRSRDHRGRFLTSTVYAFYLKDDELGILHYLLFNQKQYDELRTYSCHYRKCTGCFKHFGFIRKDIMDPSCTFTTMSIGSGTCTNFVFTMEQFDRAESYAIRNPNLIPKLPWYTRLLYWRLF